MEFAVVTTGIDIPTAAYRALLVRNIAAAHLADTKVVAQAQPSRDPLRITKNAHALHALAIWGLHHSNAPIMSATLAQRLGFTHARAHDVLIGWKNAGRMNAFRYFNEPPHYELTTDGLAYAQHWFSYLIRGSLILVQVRDRRHATILSTTLIEKVPGVAISALALREPLSSIHGALWLVLSWIVQEKGRGITAPFVARLLSAHTSTVNRIFDEFLSKGYATLKEVGGNGGGKGRPANTYALTPQGEQLAKRCVTTLLT